MRDILDQPISEQQAPTPSPYPLLLRYVITIILFPLALLRLRSSGLASWDLLLGGLWSSLQFLIAAILFVLLRTYLAKSKKLILDFSLLMLLLKTTVDLIVFVGILQLVYTHFF